MKHSFLAAIAASCFLMSCNNDNSNQKNIDASHDILKGIETGDSTKFASIPNDAIDHAGPRGEVKSGDSIRAYLMDMHNRVRDLKIEVLGDAVNGDYVYTWSKMSGTPVDSSMGFKPGVPFSIKGVDILKFSNGKAVEHWGTVDMLDMMLLNASQSPNATVVTATVDTNKKDSTVKDSLGKK